MASPVRTLTVNFTGKTESLERAFRRVNKGSALMTDKLARTMRFGVGAIGGLGAAFGGFVALTKPMVDAASDVGESLSKNTVLFGESANEVAAWSESTARSFGISKRDALEAVGNFGALTHAMGMSNEEGADMSVRMVELAADMASFNNASPEETLIAIQAGLRGESEPLRRFGVLLDAATLKTRALSEGIITSTKKALTPQQKALAAYAEILGQTTVQQGDFERTSDGLANKQRILSAVWDDLETKIGTKLLPAFEEVTAWLADEFLPGIENVMAMSGDEIGEALGDRFIDAVIFALHPDRMEGVLEQNWSTWIDGFALTIATDLSDAMSPYDNLLDLLPFDAPFDNVFSFLGGDEEETPVEPSPRLDDFPGPMFGLVPTSMEEAAATAGFGITTAAADPEGSTWPLVPTSSGGFHEGGFAGGPVGTTDQGDFGLLDPLSDPDVLKWLGTEGAQNLLAGAAVPVQNNQHNEITINTTASADEVVDRLGEYVRANGPLARGWIDQG